MVFELSEGQVFHKWMMCWERGAEELRLHREESVMLPGFQYHLGHLGTNP